MSEIKYYSEEGLQKLKDELHHLIAFDRPAAAAAIAEARDKGDLSENAEYRKRSQLERRQDFGHLPFRPGILGQARRRTSQCGGPCGYHAVRDTHY